MTRFLPTPQRAEVGNGWHRLRMSAAAPRRKVVDRIGPAASEAPGPCRVLKGVCGLLDLLRCPRGHDRDGGASSRRGSSQAASRRPRRRHRLRPRTRRPWPRSDGASCGSAVALSRSDPAIAFSSSNSCECGRPVTPETPATAIREAPPVKRHWAGPGALTAAPLALAHRLWRAYSRTSGGPPVVHFTGVAAALTGNTDRNRAGVENGCIVRL